MAQLTTGALIAGYRVDALAGQGGMGVVYRATQLSLGRTVALKLIAPGLADDPRFRERFERESRLAASIDHPNVLPVYEAGDADGTLFMAMRWVDGTDLRTLIHRGTGMEARYAARIVGQIAAGLDAAHRLGLVHRDVKPGNVLIPTGSEHAYLTDFGLMKQIRGGDELTDSGEFIGTIDYIAPEQIRGDGCDARSDVYSLGCVLFHAVCGRVPFDEDTGLAKVNAHLNHDPPRASELASDLPAGLDEVIARAMEKEPADRYATAGGFARAAAAVTGQSPPPVLGPANGTAPAETALLQNGVGGARRHRAKRRTPARRGQLAALGIAVIAVVAAGLVVLILGDSDEPQRTAAPAAPPSFSDGTLLTMAGAARPYVIKRGARFAVPPDERPAFAVDGQEVRRVSRATLRRVPLVPRDGTLLRPYRSSLVWLVEDGTRQLTQPPPGADIAIIPSTGLRQIPPVPSGRRTKVTINAPAFVLEHRRFVLSARVRSPSGIPTGTCVFYRVSPGRRKERANAPAHDGRCATRIKFGGAEQVRYSVEFIGDPGWSASSGVTRPIDVLVP